MKILIVIILMIGLYILGKFLYPDIPQRPIQQELIKWEEEQ
ncbi:MAG: hypothetical protein GOVbin1782_30 [Prokaryotic dsDNA virus sp.]|nr:MAG: hypothetical protein GOVbin1782_30 [Prokaryotic dsDNA virus sp.]